MTGLLPLSYLAAEHEYTAGTWQDFTADLAGASITLREFAGRHTAALSFYRANMDPSQSSATTVVKKGDRVRISAKNAAGTLRRMGTFKIIKVQVDIDLSKPVGFRNRVTLQLHGAGVAGVAGVGASKGVATLTELRDVITGAAFEIGGDGFGTGIKTAAGTAVEVASIDTASEFDQIALTRDSNPGAVVFEDPYGTIQIFDSATQRTGTAPLNLTKDNYSKIDMSFDMSSIINVVQFKYLEKIKAAGKPTRVKEHDVTYVNAASRAKYGPFKKKIVTHKKADFAAHANAIFARNADPAQVPNSVTVPMRTAADLLPGYEDGHYVGGKIRITDPTNPALVYSCRVARIVHDIAPDKWIVTIYLRNQDLMATPVPIERMPRPEVANTPDGTVLTAHLDTAAVDGTKLADDAVDGKTIQGAIFKTSETTPRVVVEQTGGIGQILFEPAVSVQDGLIYADGDSTFAEMVLTTHRPTISHKAATMILQTDTTKGPTVEIHGGLTIHGPDNGAPGGRTLKGIDFGLFNGTTDASGLLTIPHDLGVNPVCVQVLEAPGTTRRRTIRVQAITTTNFTVEIYIPTTSAVAASESQALFWLALA